MVIRNNGSVSFSCDHCQAIFRWSPNSQSYDYVWSQAQRAGWEAERKFGKSGGEPEWDHRCRECAKV